MTPQRLALLELSCRIPYLAEHPALLSRPPRVTDSLVSPAVFRCSSLPLLIPCDWYQICDVCFDLAADEKS